MIDQTLKKGVICSRNQLQRPRVPGQDGFADVDLVCDLGMVGTDDMGGKIGHEVALERSPCAVDPHVVVGCQGK